MTVKECVLEILRGEPRLSNQVVAERVRATLNSDTTARNIARYRREFSIHGDEIDNVIPKVELTDEGLEAAAIMSEQTDENETKNWSQCEQLVVVYEARKGATAKRISGSRTPGYDIVSTYPNGEERFIEVKSKMKGRKTWVTLTPNETTALLNEPKFWLYIVEGDITTGVVQVTEIPSIDLLKAVKMKLHGRVSNLLGYQRNPHQISENVQVSSMGLTQAGLTNQN